MCSAETTGAPVRGSLLDFSEHLREWLQEYWAKDAASEVEVKAEVESLDPEGRERETKERMEDGGEVRDPTKW